MSNPFPPDAKLVPPSLPQGGVMRYVLGVLLIVLFVVWIISGILPQFYYLLLEDHAGQNVWIEDILPSHFYWGVVAGSLVAGIGLVRSRGWALTVAVAISVCWLGMRGFHLFYYSLFDGMTIWQNLGVLMGVRFPPSFTSIATFFINLMSLVSLLLSATDGLRLELGVGRERFLKGLIWGTVFFAYGMACFLIGKALEPPTNEFIYFQF